MPFDKYNAVSVNQEGTKPTYSAGVNNFTPVAAATDILTISNPVGSGKVIRVTHIQVSGIATSGAAVLLQMLKRSTLNTGGTPTSLTAVPYDSSDIPASATVVTYGANPTLGTLVGIMKIIFFGIGTSSSVNIQEQGWDFGSKPTKCVVLRPGECASLNYNGQTPGAGTTLAFDVEWTEESS